MNYLTDERRHALSAEYVLGTLDGPARQRFQRLLMQHPRLRETLWHWEKHLNAMGAAIPERTPSPRVWQQIQERLGFDTRGSAAVIPMKSPVKTSRQPSRPGADGWRWLAGLASAAALVLAILLVWPQPSPIPDEPAQIAVVQGQDTPPLWLIELQENSLQVRATEGLDPQQNNDYELWMVAADGRPPVSLGLLPKQGSARLERPALLDQVEIAALAVSLEPLGGSPTGQPTTVLYTAELVPM